MHLPPKIALRRARRSVRRSLLSARTRSAPQPEGYAAAWFLLHQPEWVSRHVETLTLEGLSSMRRRLTMDVVLPDDGNAMMSRAGDEAIYCLPLARLSKTNPLPFIDLRDESGRVVPLRTRAENAQTSVEALEHAICLATELDHEQLSAQLKSGLKMLVFDDRPTSDLGAVITGQALDELTFRNGAHRARLDQAITHLILNSIVWVVLTGRPLEHRVLKLATTLDLGRLPFPARKRVPTTVDVKGVKLPWEGPGRIDVTGSMKILRAMVAARSGWDSIDLIVRDPAMQDARSYHLQVIPSPGLRVDRIEFDPDRETHQLPAELKPVFTHQHFYLRDEALALARAIPIAISIRVRRRGFLNVYTLAAVLITALLWCYQAGSHAISRAPDGGTVAAAVLLIVPPFLVLLASRAAENVLVSTLLAGVRVAVLACMLVSALAAAAITDVRMTDSLSASLIVYATVASVCCGAVLVAWLSSFRRVRIIAHGARRAWCGNPNRRRWSFLVLGGLCALLALAARMLDGLAVDHPAWALPAVGVVAAATIVSAVWPHHARVPLGCRVLAGVATISAVVWGVLVLAPRVLPIADGRGIVEFVALGCGAWALFSGFAVWLAPVRPRLPPSSPAGGPEVVPNAAVP